MVDGEGHIDPSKPPGGLFLIYFLQDLLLLAYPVIDSLDLGLVISHLLTNDGDQVYLRSD